MKLGIIGLPNVGKSTLFNSITKSNSAKVSNYPFCTINQNTGIATVSDERLDFLERLYKPKRKTQAIIEFTDIAGLIKGASHGEGLGNKFLEHIRKTSAIVHVVRCFDDSNITHISDCVIDPIKDIEIINTELILADLELIIKKNELIKKKIKSNVDDKDINNEKCFITKLEKHLNNGNPARTIKTTNVEKKILKNLFLITSKPILYVCNVSENDLPTMKNKYTEAVKEKLRKEDVQIINVCAKVEYELCRLSKNDQYIFLKNFGLKESSIDSLVKSWRNLLNLITFFTVGKDEVKAWTIKNGTLAQKAAGLIHSDFERGFIRAEIISFNDLAKFCDEKLIKNVGLLRKEGREYMIKDGDIVEFRFNV